ncbi:MAG: sugar phosphate isomerase/epimerase family protein [Gemmataceae bacterium]
MKLAFSTNAYLNHSFDETCRRLSQIGYSGIEIMADVPHAWPAYLLPEQVQGLRNSLVKYNLKISNVNAFMMHAVDDPRQKYWHPSWIEPDPHYRRIRIEHTKRCLSLARDLGAPNVTTEPGGPLEGRSWKECLNLFIEELKPVVEHAEKVKVPLLIEPEPGLLLETAEQYLEFASKIHSRFLGLNFDIGHSFCVNDDPASTILKLDKLIHHVHLEDIAATRVHHHLIPGEGVIDFASTLAALKRIGYKDWVTIELYTCHENPDTAAKLARERVTTIASTLGIIFQ